MRKNLSLQYQYNVKQISDENLKKNIIRGLLIDLIPNSSE